MTGGDAMPVPDYEEIVQRRRIWGVPPDAVERFAAACQQEQADLRARIAELKERVSEAEGRLADATEQQNDATQRASVMQDQITALQERIAQLTREKEEVTNRPEAIREEAMRFVVDAWAEAQAIREQSRKAIAEAEAASREEVATMRRALVDERRRHEAEIAALRERRQKAIADLESLAATLLRQAAQPAMMTIPTAERPASAVRPDSGTRLPTRLEAVPSLITREAPAPAVASPPPLPSPTPRPTPTAAPRKGKEDELLAKALDDLEAMLTENRENG